MCHPPLVAATSSDMQLMHRHKLTSGRPTTLRPRRTQRPRPSLFQQHPSRRVHPQVAAFRRISPHLPARDISIRPPSTRASAPRLPALRPQATTAMHQRQHTYARPRYLCLQPSRRSQSPLRPCHRRHEVSREAIARLSTPAVPWRQRRLGRSWAMTMNWDDWSP